MADPAAQPYKPCPRWSSHPFFAALQCTIGKFLLYEAYQILRVQKHSSDYRAMAAKDRKKSFPWVDSRQAVMYSPAGISVNHQEPALLLQSNLPIVICEYLLQNLPFCIQVRADLLPPCENGSQPLVSTGRHWQW